MSYLIRNMSVKLLQLFYDVMVFLLMPCMLFIVACLVFHQDIGAVSTHTWLMLIRMTLDSALFGVGFGLVALWLPAPHIIYSTFFAVALNLIVAFTGKFELVGALPLLALLAHIILTCLSRLSLLRF